MAAAPERFSSLGWNMSLTVPLSLSLLSAKCRARRRPGSRVGIVAAHMRVARVTGSKSLGRWLMGFFLRLLDLVGIYIEAEGESRARCGPFQNADGTRQPSAGGGQKFFRGPGPESPSGIPLPVCQDRAEGGACPRLWHPCPVRTSNPHSESFSATNAVA